MFLLMFFVFSGLNLVATRLNHIDDTDETFGYWEVLHYWLYGHGMQTWEYSPDYAIRTYAFIAPLWGAGEALKAVLGRGDDAKVEVFYGIRVLLGIFTALAQAKFLTAIRQSHGVEGPLLFRLTLLLLVFAPGVFFSSTSFLPSAVAMSCVMMCCSEWMMGKHLSLIFWGSVAVLMTGWPFVGLIVLPLGIHMLVQRFQLSGQLMGVVNFAFSALRIVAVVAITAGAIDIVAYKRTVSPTLNIFLYNAVGSKEGDELYGTAPASYYIRNLFLNLGVSWPLALAGALLTLRSALEKPGALLEPTRQISLTMQISGALWLGVLFARPHKEERFMYPAYPLLAYLGAQGLVALVNLVGRLAAALLGISDPPSLSHLLNLLPAVGARAGSKGKDKATRGVREGLAIAVKHVCLVVAVAAAAALSCSRVASNVNNYAGYMQLWLKLGKVLRLRRDREIRVCTGGEWHFFPSHFFLPSHVRLAFVRDSFHGQLPQLFREDGSGSWAPPLQPFNKLNREELSRYTDLDSCDFVVALIDPDGDQTSHGPMVASMTLAGTQGAAATGGGFAFVADEPVLDPSRSSSALARAFFIPGLSKDRNKFNRYTAFANEGKR